MSSDEPPKTPEIVRPGQEGALIQAPDEPPIVARLVVEIRSDGSRTIARGALEDATLGKKVAIQAEGTSPMALAVALMKSMVQAPFLGAAFKGGSVARSLAKALLGRPKKKP